MSYSTPPNAFDMAAYLAAARSYFDVTQRIIQLLSSFPTVSEVNSYEILGTTPRRNDQVTGTSDFLVRRFPLSLEADYSDEKLPLINQVVHEGGHGFHNKLFQNRNFVVLYLRKDILPHRMLLLEGSPSSQELETIKGLSLVYEELIKLLDSKERDPLTHLHNRQTLDLTLQQVLDFYQKEKNKTEDKKSWIALLDIDHFKTINDKFGHLYGDEVLIHFSNLMKSCFRYTDFLFRYGGEEFLAIINQTDGDGVAIALERFRSMVQQYQFPSNNITVSIGYTLVDQNRPASSLIEAADQALYSAKSNGRNQVTYLAETNSVVKATDDIELF